MAEIAEVMETITQVMTQCPECDCEMTISHPVTVDAVYCNVCDIKFWVSRDAKDKFNDNIDDPKVDYEEGEMVVEY